MLASRPSHPHQFGLNAVNAAAAKLLSLLPTVDSRPGPVFGAVDHRSTPPPSSPLAKGHCILTHPPAKISANSGILSSLSVNLSLTKSFT